MPEKAIINGCIKNKQPFMVAIIKSNHLWLLFLTEFVILSIKYMKGRRIMEVYTSLIIDIKKSRLYSVEIRNKIQNYILRCVAVLNDILKQHIVFDVDFSAGDELQGLFKDTVSAFMYVRMLGIMVKPVELRAGIGIGEWNVRISGGSTRQDGPAYHIARRAITEVHSRQTERFRIIAGENADIMGNYLMNASMKHLQEQTLIQGQVQFVSEMMYPFVLSQAEEDRVNQYGGALLEDFLTFRQDMSPVKALPDIEGAAESTGPYIVNRVNAGLSVQKAIYISDELEDGERKLEHPNMSSIMADITGSTRQNMEKMIKRGNVMIIRNMDFMAIQYLRMQYGG